MHILSVRFPRNIEDVKFTANEFSGGHYDYLSPVAQAVGQLVVVPVYSRNARLRLAEVVDSIEVDDMTVADRIGKLRYVIDIIDTNAFERFEEERKNHAKALQMIRAAYEQRAHVDMFKAVAESMSEQQREFIRVALRIPKSLATPGDERSVMDRTGPHHDA